MLYTAIYKYEAFNDYVYKYMFYKLINVYSIHMYIFVDLFNQVYMDIYTQSHAISYLHILLNTSTRSTSNTVFMIDLQNHRVNKHHKVRHQISKWTTQCISKEICTTRWKIVSKKSMLTFVNKYVWSLFDEN